MDHNWWLNKGMNTKWPEHLDLGSIERNLPKIQVEFTLLVVLREKWLDPGNLCFSLPATLPLQKLPTACPWGQFFETLRRGLEGGKELRRFVHFSELPWELAGI